LGEAGGINLYAYVANSPINYIDPLGLDLQLSISAGGVIGGNPYSDYPIGEQSFWTLSLSLGVSVSSDGFQIFLQSQNSSLTGFGTFGGGGISGGISHSDCHIKSGTSIDTNQHVEANVGVWATTGYSGDYSDSSGGVSFPIPKLDIGAGGGAMVANGPATTYTISSPVIGFAPPTGTAYTPVTNVNSPPNSWSP
jgi:uncharacterized protein RhaS with RHS repeats